MKNIPPNLKEEATSPHTLQLRLQELAKKSIELARIVASNTNTNPHLLQKLGNSKDIK